MVRRAEYALGKAIRAGQERGEVETEVDARSRAGQIARGTYQPDETRLIPRSEFASEDEWRSNGAGMEPRRWSGPAYRCLSCCGAHQAWRSRSGLPWWSSRFPPFLHSIGRIPDPQTRAHREQQYGPVLAGWGWEGSLPGYWSSWARMWLRNQSRDSTSGMGVSGRSAACSASSAYAC